MRRISSLPWFLMVMGSTVLAAAGPGAPVRPRPQVEKSEPKRQPTPTPAPRVAAKPAPAPAPKPASKPTVAKVEAPRPSAPKAPAPSPLSKKTAELAASGSRALALPKPVAPDIAAPRRSLREGDLWLGAIATQHTALKAQLAEGSAEMERIGADASLAALTSERNRNEAAIPAAAALRANSQRDWREHLNTTSGRPAPVQVEQLMKQGETIAFRTNTSTSDTQNMVARIRRTPGVAAGGHVGVDGMSSDLMISHLRTLSGTLSDSQARQPYAVQHIDGLRARLEKGRVALDEQFAEVRQAWLSSSTRADELNRQYMDLRRKLVAPDE